MSLFYILRHAKALLQSAFRFVDDEDSWHQVFLIAQSALGWSKGRLFENLHETVSSQDAERILTWVQKRIQGMPLQYLEGKAFFMNYEFEVGQGVFIPRPETEVLVDVFLRKTGEKPLTVFELGAGCGNIGISICLQRTDVHWYGFEANPESTPYLKRNLKNLLNSDPRFRVVEGDFFSFRVEESLPVDWVVSNPPYVRTSDLAILPLEVRAEPTLALDGGQDGLRVIERLIEYSAMFLRVSNVLLEVADGQAHYVVQRLQSYNYHRVEVFHDFSGIERVILGSR